MRALTKDEVVVLEHNNCHSDDWPLITVAEGFDPMCCRDVVFIGQCTIGDLSGSRTNEYGVPIPNGIRSARIHECTIGDGVCIDHIHDCLSRYDIGDHVTITNVDVVAMKGESSFGVGVRASVLNETGGIEVPISRNLNAQTAYMLTLMSFQDRALRVSLIELIDAESEAVRSTRGIIEEHVEIKNTGSIVNAFVGAYATIEGATKLENCSLCSSVEHPIRIGYNVQGRDFIASLGAMIGGSSIVERCFVGQSCHIDHLFSAHDSLIFANCNLENGEACAIFAGPFTVSSHKSSLLIAGHFSFLNAGSGSNQSNHLYKLGPIHQGVVERGSKTSSDSYVLWPSRIGAFTLVMGRHVHNVDTTDFPFSYLIESENKSFLVPGRSLLSVGTMRDAKKWPARDKRPKSSRPDCINYNLLSPFTIGKMECAYNKLKSLQDFLGLHDHVYAFNNIFIKSSSLKRGLETYRWGIEKFVGNSLIQRIQDKFGDKAISSQEELLTALRPDHTEGTGEWIDMSGMIAPIQGIHEIIRKIKSGALATLPEVNSAVRDLHSRYYDLEWDWSYELLCRWFGEPLSASKVVEIIEKWLRAVVAIDQALLNDAHKEYNIIGRVNLGIQPDNEMNRSYGEQIEEEFSHNSIVLSVQEHIERKRALASAVLAQLSGLC
ncbi:DUF4954 family protein [Porphyromonas levii]|uniref:DUF4954 family protein n=1 Tax=Porphyromonas levii TaxID=28114 RepID=UPI00038104D5|nr:DUF4954 family protein [Porphyromonas levii]